LGLDREQGLIYRCRCKTLYIARGDYYDKISSDGDVQPHMLWKAKSWINIENYKEQ
jgi:hypothetical protein